MIVCDGNGYMKDKDTNIDIHTIYRNGVYTVTRTEDIGNKIPSINFYKWDEESDNPILQHIADFAVDANGMYPSYERICEIFSGNNPKDFIYSDEYIEIFPLANGEKMSVHRSGDMIQISIKDPIFGQIYNGTGYFDKKNKKVVCTRNEK